MVTPTGTRLGVYDVTALMGEGAMERWSAACDTKLNRDVGLRVLSDSFASDPDRLARVTREAKTFASLNHPNVTQRLQPDAQRTMIWKSLLLPALLACAVTSASAQAELPVEVRAAMDKAATEVLQTTGAPSASSAVVRDGKVAYVNAYGRASLDPPVNATPEMRYSIGSISKPFTAAAVLLLAGGERSGMVDLETGHHTGSRASQGRTAFDVLDMTTSSHN